jgi:hypothetical protein
MRIDLREIDLDFVGGVFEALVDGLGMARKLEIERIADVFPSEERKLWLGRRFCGGGCGCSRLDDLHCWLMLRVVVDTETRSRKQLERQPQSYQNDVPSVTPIVLAERVKYRVHVKVWRIDAS